MATKDDRIEELEGLLASTTRRLEGRERQIAELEAELEQAELIAERVQNLEVDLGVGTSHVAMIDRALERLAGFIAETGDDDDLWAQVGRDDETRVSAAANAILTLANARDRIVAKPTPKPTPLAPR